MYAFIASIIIFRKTGNALHEICTPSKNGKKTWNELPHHQFFFSYMCKDARTHCCRMLRKVHFRVLYFLFLSLKNILKRKFLKIKLTIWQTRRRDLCP